MKPAVVMRDRPVVLFSITNGWGIRNFVHTGLFKSVARFADIGVASSSELVSVFQGMQNQGQIAFVVEVPARESAVWRRIRQSKKALFQTVHDISTAKIKWYRGASGLVGRGSRIASWALLRMLAARWQVNALESLERKLSSTDLCLPRSPSVMVNCSPFDYRDNQLQRSMQAKGVRTISIIPSWDNPSTKGCILSDPDLVLAWGNNQKHEVMAFYPMLDPQRIKVSGIPQFDRYYQELPEVFWRATFLSRLQIHSDRRIILYATCSERLFPTEPEVVADVLSALVRGCFGNDAHLLIRCHPADRMERYQHLGSSKRVTIWPSSIKSFQNLYSWIPPEYEIDALAATLRHCEVCINTASTMTLDAFACGKPVVNVAYDGERMLPYLKSVRRFYDHHHYLPIARSGAVLIAGSAAELIKAIERSLRKPEELQPQRDEIVSELCPHPAGGSVELIVREIERFTL